MAEQEITEEVIQEIRDRIASNGDIKELSERFRPEDLAEIIDLYLEEEEQVTLFRTLDPETASEVFVMLGTETRDNLVAEHHVGEIARIVKEMESDDAADFLGTLDEAQVKKILAHLPLKETKALKKLLEYAEDTAGGLMQLELLSTNATMTCKDAISLVRREAEVVEEFHNIFVTDDDGTLMGVVPLRKLILYPKETRILTIMEPDPISVHVAEDAEEVAAKFRKYDVVSLPVVDAENKLVGRIMHDDVLDVITDESTEDILKTAGTDEQELDSASWLEATRYRLPWLLSSMVGGMVMAGIIHKLGAPLEHVLALAAFIPVITGMSGNVSTQTSAIMVRAIVLGRAEGGVLAMVIKELWVSVAMATFCGGLIGIIAWGYERDAWIGFVVGFSLFMSMGFASMLGTTIPVALHRMKFDPVLGAGPIVLTSVDIAALIIYFSFATFMLRYIS